MSVRTLKPHTYNRYGHQMISVKVDGRHTSRQVHRLVLEAFVGPCPEGMECRHLDGNPANNHVDNLRWGTHVDNMADRKAHGTNTTGEKHHKAQLTADDVYEIRRRCGSGEPVAKVARDYQMSWSAVDHIKHRRNWRHI